MRHGTKTRRRASLLFAGGASRAEVARRLGIARSTSSAWRGLWAQDALLADERTGRRPRLDNRQLAHVGRSLLQPPSVYGMHQENWSLHSIALLIQQQTGVRYHHRHVGRLTQRMGWLVPPLERYAAAARFVQPIETPVGPMNVLITSLPSP